MSYKQTDVHHILARAVGGSSNPENMERKNKRQHANYHSFFVTDNIKEAVERLLRWTGKALREEAIIKIAQSISEEDVRFYYKKQCFKTNL